VKIERVGNAFSGYISADGQAWTQLGSAVTIAMADPVCIGLAVTSHASGQVRTFTFDSVSSTGDVTGEFATEQIGIAYNAPQPIYAAVEDAAGVVGVVSHPDPAATMITSSWSWKVPLSEFADAGVDLANVASVYLGAGDLINPTPDGKGTVKFDDVRVVLPVVILGHNDVTSSLDNVKGVPNDGDWPGAEYPALAVDDKVSTKFLHFKGETEPTGIQIEPMAGATLVTGLAFTTANDAVERDPTTFELYGSNESIDGPFELIASGDIVDFAGEAAWPRFTRNTTPIAFDNTVAYKFYQVLFPTVRDPAAANSMQIAEIELLGGTTNNIISAVSRANGTSGNRAPVGAFDGSTKPLPTEPGGLMDGNMVYSDRTYPWNQTPAELVGVEYIRIFNTDKGTADGTYTVTISRAATVAVAHDDRIQPAQDQVDMITAGFAPAGTFQDTGVDIFIYESASTPARPLSVFTADLEAGTYVLKTEASSNTMYIVLAIEKQ
jgi:hypothetical protein